MLVASAAAQTPVDRNAVHNVFTVDALFDEWDTTYPEFVERMTIGESEGGLPLHGIVVTDESVAFDDPPHTATTKWRVYLDGGHHGNEFLGVELALYGIEEILDLASRGDDATLQLLRSTEIHVVPILNVEGNLRDTRVNLNGFDPNRNYDFGHVPCPVPIGLTCGGPEPFSESEIHANSRYVLATQPDLWLSMHTGIEVLFYPAGDPFPDGKTVDQPLFDAMEPLFEEAAGGRIDMTGGPAPAVGSAEDWGYAIVGVNSFVYEVHNDQNLPVYGEPLTDLLADQLAGLRFLVDGAPRWGAHIEVTPTEGGLRLANLGLGDARNVELTVQDTTRVFGLIPAGTEVVTDCPCAGPVSWSYPKLLVDSSQVREHEALFEAAPEAPSEGAPALPLVFVLVALAALVRIQR